MSHQLTIRIGRSSLSFLCDGEAGKVFSTYEMNGSMSAAANLREAFKTLQPLQQSWAKATVLADVPTLLVPEEEYADGDAEKLFAHAFSGHDGEVKLSQPMEALRAVVVFALERDIQTVVGDHCATATYLPTAMPLWQQLGRQGGGSRLRLYGYFHDGRVDVFAFGRQRFKFANTFNASDASDALYYLLSVFNQLGMKGDRDEVTLLGSTPHLKFVSDNLASYVRRIHVADAETMHLTPADDDMPIDMAILLNTEKS